MGHQQPELLYRALMLLVLVLLLWMHSEMPEAQSMKIQGEMHSR